MKLRRRGTRRKAVSPVLATVILIAITLVAAVAVGGFFFGLMGNFTSGNAFSGYSIYSQNGTSTTSGGTTTTTSSNPVTVTPTSCTASGKSRSKCALTVTNNGSSNAVVSKNSCLINVGGKPTVGSNPSRTIKPGASTSFTCYVLGAEPPKGTSLTGFVALKSGPSPGFTGVWS